MPLTIFMPNISFYVERVKYNLLTHSSPNKNTLVYQAMASHLYDGQGQ